MCFLENFPENNINISGKYKLNIAFRKLNRQFRKILLLSGNVFSGKKIKIL